MSPMPDAPDLPVLTFRRGLVGFDGPQRFHLVRWGGDDSPFSVLQSLDDPDLAFVVVPPQVFFADYEPEIDDEAAAHLGVASAEDLLLLVIVHLADDPRDATANLLGPLVVNTRTLEGIQAVLSPERWPSRRPLALAAAAA